MSDRDLLPGEAAKMLGITRQGVHWLYRRKRIQGRKNWKGWLLLDRDSVLAYARTKAERRATA